MALESLLGGLAKGAATQTPWTREPSSSVREGQYHFGIIPIAENLIQ